MKIQNNYLFRTGLIYPKYSGLQLNYISFKMKY